jgi:transposase
MRPARPASSRLGCCTAWGALGGDRAVADPRAPGDKVKTDKRDGRRLARLHRAGELVAIRVPTVAEEAVRDLCRTRADMVEDLGRARQRLGKFLLRHGRPWRGGSTWTHAYQAWLGSQRFHHPALTQTFGHYLAVVEVRNTQPAAVEADLAGWCGERRSTGRSPGWPPTAG